MITTSDIDHIITVATKQGVPFISKVSILNEFISSLIKAEVEEREDANAKSRGLSKILLVEDGSVDVDELTEQLKDNSDIKIVVYRQNARIPMLMSLSEIKD